MIFGDYIIIKKSNLLAAAALATAGCLLYRHYSKPGNDIRSDVEDLKDDAEKAVRKGRTKAKEVAEDMKDDK